MTLRYHRLAAVSAMLAVVATSMGCAAQTTSSSSGTAGGPAAVPGFDLQAGTIKVGNVLALSGPISATAKEQLVGQQAWFNKVNADGGIAGKYKIQVVTADNQYNPQLAVQAYQKIAGDVVMLSGVLGAPSVNALVPILDRSSGMMVPSAQDSHLRSIPAALPTFSSYQTNVVNAVSYLAEKSPTMAKARYCALVMDSEWGKADTEALTFITKAVGAPLGTVEKFAPLDTAFTAQITELKRDGCDVVVFGGAANNLPSVIAAATQLDFRPQWIAEFIANSTAFKKSPITDYLTKHVLFTGPGAKLDDTSVEGVRVLREALGKTEITVQHVYGYMQALATTQLLEKAVKNGDLSGAGLRRASTELDKLTFQGLGGEVQLGAPADRVLPRTSTIYAYDVAAPSGLNAVAVQYQAPEGSNPDF
jgi:ABC-type branched-subunit amino acid transport system substrate-binding protein